MKTITTLFLILILSSCKKDSTKEQCYDCHILTTVAGIHYDEHREYCGPEPIPPFTDALGNPLNMGCTKK